MKLPNLCFASLTTLLLCCKNATNTGTADKHQENKGNIISPGVDKDFNTFLTYFSKDSVFQISRIAFPLKVEELELNDSLEMIEKVLEREDHQHMDFSPPKFESNLDNYTQKVRVDKDKATIEIRGIDNGLLIDYIFEKRNNRWMLITWTDSST
jgi:hypothetical protein